MTRIAPLLISVSGSKCLAITLLIEQNRTDDRAIVDRIYCDLQS
ncbi:hypothetical protein [Chamaesiphon minutus]|nr:hypothetical protein [Chamaesiphon minutus]